MIAAIAAWAAKSALMQSPVGGFLKMVPRSVWIGLAVAAAITIAVIWHGRQVESLRAEAYQAGVTDTEKRIEKKALKIKRDADALTASISAKHRSQSDEENRAIARAADNQRVRGPGRAICPGGASLAGASGGHVAPGGAGDAAVDRLPDEAGTALMAVPFASTVDFAEQHDLNRAEVLRWRAWYAELSAAWAKMFQPEGAKDHDDK